MKDALSKRFRQRRDALLRRTIATCPRRDETLRILDVGGQVAYWRRFGLEFLAQHKVHVTLVNITELNLGPMTDASAMFSSEIANGCALPFDDNAFDLCHSNSVIEHVGLWRDMQAFARETRRVAPSYYVQSPNFAFPIDPHFWAMPGFHWFPRPLRAAMVWRLPLATGGRAADLSQAYDMVDSARLLTRGQMRVLFPEAELATERLMLLPKSYSAIHVAAAPAS